MPALLKNLQRNRLAFTASAIAIVLLVLALVGYNLWRLRVATLESQLDAVAQNAAAFEEHLTQTLSVIDVNLTNLAEQASQEPAIQGVLRNARYLRSISVVGAGGKIVSSSELRNVGLHFSSDAYLPAAANTVPVLRVAPLTGGRDLFNARAIAPGATAPTQSFIAVQRDVLLASGEAIKLVAVINPDYFLNYYERNVDIQSVDVALLRIDGSLLLSTTENYQPGIKTDLQVFNLLAKSEAGKLQQAADKVKTDRLTGYRASRFYPVVVVVNFDTAQVLQSWRNEVRSTLLFTFVALGLVLSAGLFFFRRYQRLAVDRSVWIRALDTQKYALDQHAIVSRTDTQGNITYANDKFCSISGYSREELLGRNHRLVKSAHHTPDFYTEMWDTISGGEVWHGEVCNRRKSGELYWVSASIVPLLGPDGLVKEYIGIRTDITDRKATELSLEVAKVAAEQASVSKSQFLANMSHEIRTPMNAILGMLQLLQHTSLSTEQKDYAVKTEGAARSLLGLLNDILDFSKVEAGKMELDVRPFALADVQRDVNVILSSNLANKPVRLVFTVEPGVPSHMLGDDMRLQQILLNLGGNAVKFTEQGEVNIRVRKLADVLGVNRVEFSVQDSGIGIAPQHMDHIFDGFTQAEGSTTRRFGGTGLGLAICQRLVGLMGGELQLTSTLGKGSRFYFSVVLPEVQEVVHAVVASPAAVQTAQLTPLQRLAGMRILVVEDNKINQMIAKGLLTKEGADITLAENGALGVQALANAQPPFDAVLMDLQMPVMDGLEAARSIRKDLGIAYLPIIAMTANVMASDREACFAAGMNEHMGKPFELERLVQLLLRLVKNFSSAPQKPASHLTTQSILLQEYAPGDLDEATALARVGGDTAVYARVLQAFEAEMRLAPDQLRIHLAAGATDLAKRTIHTLKGLSATIGARHLSAISAKLEIALKEGVASEEHPRMLAQLQSAMDALLPHLAALLLKFQPQPSSDVVDVTSAPFDKAELQRDLQALARMLESSNMLAIEAYTRIQKRYGPQMEEDFAPLDDAMGRFEFAVALEMCKEIIFRHFGHQYPV